MRYNPAFVLLVLLCFWQNTNAQSVRIETVTQEDGLPNDLTKALAMDSLGFIWVATDDGIVYIHGRSFNIVTNPPMFSNNYKSLLFTRNFGFIASADPGLYAIENQSEEYKAIMIKDQIPLFSNTKFHYPKTLYESKFDGTVWIADLRNVFHLTKDSLFTYYFDLKNHTDHFNRSYQFFEVHDHLYTFSQHGYLFKLDPKRNKFEEINTDLKGIEIYKVINIGPDKILIGHKNGFSIFQLNDEGKITSSELFYYEPVLSACLISENKIVIGTESAGAAFLYFSGKDITINAIKEINDLTINDIICDLSGNYWFATDHGIIILREVMFGDPFKNISRHYIQDLKLTQDGKIFFTDGIVFKLDPQKDNPELFYKPEKGMIIRLSVADNGIWMATNDGIIIYRSNDGKEKKYDLKQNGLAIYGLEVDKEGYVWFIQEQKNPVLIRMAPDGSWVNLTPPDDSIRLVSCIKKSPEKEIYIGGQGNDHYLFKYDYLTKKLQNLSRKLSDEQYKSIRVTDMAFDSTNHIILATTNGLWIYSPEQMLHFDLGEMTNDMIHSLTFDHNKQLWFTNANGISQIRGTDCITYNNNDGLPSKTCTFRTLVTDNCGQMWAGTISGLAKGKIETTLINTPKPVLLSANCSGEFISTKTLIKAATNDLLTFQFGTPVYPAKYLKYRYSLTCIGSEHEILTESSENIILSNLKQGKYQLTVQVRNHGNYLWSNPVSISFEVKKLWYTRIWVITLMLFFILLISLVFISYLRWKNRKMTAKLEQIIEERTRSFQEQNEELIALNEKLKEARDQAEQAIKSKDRFFSILAHDLKSPFNTLIGFAQLLVFNRDELSNEDMQHLLDEMLSTSENTYKLLQNLLDWARSQTGAIKMKNQPFHLNDLIEDVLKVSEPSARQKQINIKVEVDQKIKMVGDVLFLTTVIRNLVANSIKFSFQNSSIAINARLVDHSVEIKIKDQGVGIPEDKIPELFRIEHSYSTSGTANEKGTGLGLILCYEFISKMGGMLSVESKLGHGSTFSIILPEEAPMPKNPE